MDDVSMNGSDSSEPSSPVNESIDADMGKHRGRVTKTRKPPDYEEEEGEITDDEDDDYASPHPSMPTSLIQNIKAVSRLSLNASSPDKVKRKKRVKRDVFEFNDNSDDEMSRLSLNDPKRPKLDSTEKTPKQVKKVPPLRISLAPKPDDDTESTPIRSVGPTPGPSTESTPVPEVKKHSTRSGGKKTAAQTNRVTRSQRRANEDAESPRRRTRGAVSSSLLSGFDDYDGYYGMSPGLGMDDDDDESQSRYNFPQAPPPEKAWAMIQLNNFAGSKAFTELMHDFWNEMHPLKQEQPPPEIPKDFNIPNFDKFMLNVRDYDLAEDKEKPSDICPPFIPPDMPCDIRDLFLKQYYLRQEKKDEFETQRNHLQLFGERQYIRALLRTMKKERSSFSVISKMRDEISCNPVNFDSCQKDFDNPSRKPLNVQEVIDNCVKKAKSLFHKQFFEANVIHRAQVAELETFAQEYELDDDFDATQGVPKIYIYHVNFNYLEDPDPNCDDDEVTRELKRPISPAFLDELEKEYAEIGGPRLNYVSKREQKLIDELKALEEADANEEEKLALRRGRACDYYDE